ncbi:signal peptide peptidase SppA [Leptospira sp. GIMC2001]|uniref:signal peptide peptidase SppA n=1 Tax=Leptospira sp. GIMC2001 TaxID=1513297 RepID=UPI00234B0DC6|nr:signal peptide peptidase SppA [Leptospira sp. GIMC2001]WCL48671.1 signal peptide peptidase SppA [Leptospira sp. GIMC2001]
MTYSKILTFLILFTVSFLTQNCFFSLLPSGMGYKAQMEEKIISGEGKDKIAMITIDGVISDDTKENFFGFESESPVSIIAENLKMIEKDKMVKGVILKINSPGGTVTASDIIYSEIERFKKKTNLPIMTVFMDVGASGAYYIAMSSDIIAVHPTTVTGSIGVIMSGFNFKEGLDKIGVKEQSITSGKNKALASPFQEINPEHKAILQGIVNNLYDRFYSIVKKGRPNLKDDQLRPLCDGRVFTGEQALKLGLVDQVGYFDEFLPTLMNHPKYKASVGSSDPFIVTYSRGRDKVENIYQARTEIPKDSLIEKFLPTFRSARFYYLWSL